MLNFIVVRSFSLQSLSQVRALSGCNIVRHRRVSSVLGGKSSLIRNLRSQAGDSESNSKASTSDQLEEYRNKNNIDDQVLSALSDDGSVKVTACTARNLLNDLMLAHTMTAVPADALGRTIVCALMMSNGMQPEQTCQITLNCTFV